MEFGFRARSFAEAMGVLGRRKWHILMPALAFGIASAIVVARIPGNYKSSALLAIKAPPISSSVVESSPDGDMSTRLRSITQEIQSRSNLEKLVTKFNLYQKERAVGQSLESAAETMRRNISVEMQNDGKDGIVGFRVAFVGQTPDAAWRVTNALADIYVAQRTDELAQTAVQTSDYVERQIRDAKAELDIVERERLKFMVENADALPDSSQALIVQLDGLRRREESIAKENDTLLAEKGRLGDQLATTNSQLRLAEDFGARESQDAAQSAARIEDSPAYAELVNRRAALTAQLDKLLRVYKDKHPDVVSKRDEITSVNRELDALKKTTEERIRTADQATSRRAEFQRKNLALETERVKSQITRIDDQMRRNEKLQQENSVRIAQLEERINKLPDVKIALESFAPRYESAKTVYDGLLDKYKTSSGQAGRGQASQGPTIEVVDRATQPTSPTNASKRPFMIGVGIALGLFIGLFTAALFELPRFFKVQNALDVNHYAGLPNVFSIPSLATEREISRRRWKLRAGWAAGLAFSLASVPVLVFLLQRLQLFERFSG